ERLSRLARVELVHDHARNAVLQAELAGLAGCGFNLCRVAPNSALCAAKCYLPASDRAIHGPFNRHRNERIDGCFALSTVAVPVDLLERLQAKSEHRFTSDLVDSTIATVNQPRQAATALLTN